MNDTETLPKIPAARDLEEDESPTIPMRRSELEILLQCSGRSK